MFSWQLLKNKRGYKNLESKKKEILKFSFSLCNL